VRLEAALATAAIGLAVLAGCIGPKYVRPSVPTPPAFKEASPGAYRTAIAGTWQPARPSDMVLKGKWWELFGDPELNVLEEQLDVDNQNIAQSFENFMAARAQVHQARAAYFPTVTAAPSYTKSHIPSAVGAAALGGAGAGAAGAGAGAAGAAGNGASGVPGTFSEVSLPFDVSWEPDLWGRIRNMVREYRAAAQVSAADLENERLTEEADLAEYYFELRGQDSLQDLSNRTVAAYRQSLQLTRGLHETGIDSDEDVAQAEVTLAGAEATATGIASNRAIYEHAIATLIGKPASSFSMPVKSLTTAAPSIPIGFPSQLLERRPDVAAAERTMAEANALIGVETTAYFPTLTLTGSTGLESATLSKLFTAPAWFWTLGASATETLFDGGLRRATLEQYTAQYNADVAAYRQTVLTAFQQVEDYIATLRVSSEQLVRQRSAVSAAQRYLKIATARYETGLDPYLDVTSAENTLLSDEQTEVTLEVSELSAAVELIQALGGGWDAARLGMRSN
jgi:NodT family efflux transporter outer membrane factor (OMF) lipoprotein